MCRSPCYPGVSVLRVLMKSNICFSVALLLIMLLTPSWVLGAVVINEFMALNQGNLPDPRGEYEDWIEIFNDSELPLDLAGLYLTDDLSNLTKWQFPSDAPKTHKSRRKVFY